MKSKRLLSIVLAVVLVLGLAPAMSIPVKAAGNGKAIQMGGGAIAAGDTVYYGSAGNQWRVLSLSGSGGTYSDGTNSVAADSALFLFSKEALFQTVFHDSENNYTNSTLRAELNNRITNYFTTGEESALLFTTKGGESIQLAGQNYSDPGLSGDRLFALSANELQAYLGYSDDRASWTEGLSGLDWWLRSAYADNSYEAGAVYSDGNPVDHTVDYGRVWARPAFNLNLNSVLFTSAATGGKSPGAGGADALADIGTNAGSEWKVTLKGLAPDFDVSYCPGTYDSGAITVKYSGADGNYISAIVTDSTGQTIKKYGKIAAVNGTDGEVTINTAGKMEEGDILFVFCEQDNGDKKTDYASELKKITLPPAGHVWQEATCTEPKTCTICGATEGEPNGHSFTYALSEGQTTITATCAAENCPSGYHDNGISVTLNAPENLAYDGTAKEATISGYPDTAVPRLADKPNVVYYKSAGEGSTEPDGSALSGAPKDAGNYVAQITWGEKTAGAAFTITRNVISYQVTFIVTNGSWDDKSSGDKTVTLSRYEDEELALVLKDTDIPAVGNEPAEHYKAGSWDVTPSTETAITKDTTYTYTYAEKAKISRTVTFKVVNGSWDDEKTEDVVVTLNGEEGDILKLSADQIPAVGNKPDDTYKAGSWDTEPNAETAITTDTTYTYTYAKKDTISAKVTFKVVNGSWDDEKTEDVDVTLNGEEGDILKLSADQIPAVGNKPDDTYKAGSWDTVPDTTTAITKDTTYTYTYAQKPVYNVIEGANGKVTKNSGKGLTFKTDGDYAKFTGIKIDDKNVASSLYDSRSGSTIVELKAVCINQLSVGKHTIQFLYTDGSCETAFEVQQAVTPTKTPTATPTRTPGKSGGMAAKTGDNNSMGLWTLLLSAAAAGIVLTLVWRRRTGRN